MKERPLDFNRQNNPAIVEDPNGELITKLKKQYKEICQNLGLAIMILERAAHRRNERKYPFSDRP